MADAPDFFNPPRPAFHLWRHPFFILVLVLLLYGAGHLIYHLFSRRPATALSLAEPDGDWVGEFTFDGRYWFPTIDGDTPGPHRHGVIFIHLGTTDAFLDHHGGPGDLRIVGEGITRPVHLYDWKQNPDGTIDFGFNSSPLLFQNEFTCNTDGNTLTCKNDDPLQPHLTLHPGSATEADALFRQVIARAATEPPLTPFPATHQEVICSDANEEVTVAVPDEPPGKHSRPAKKQKPPRSCGPADEN